MTHMERMGASLIAVVITAAFIVPIAVFLFRAFGAMR